MRCNGTVNRRSNSRQEEPVISNFVRWYKAVNGSYWLRSACDRLEQTIGFIRRLWINGGLTGDVNLR